MLKSTFQKIITDATISELVGLIEWCSLPRDQSPSSVRFGRKLVIKNQLTIDSCINEIRCRNEKNNLNCSDVDLCA